VRQALGTAPTLMLDQLRPAGYVLATLAVGIRALCQPTTLERDLVDVVNLGDNADTAAVASPRS
jgi:hypothetical protein